MTTTLDILCLKGKDEATNFIKESDLSILLNELDNKKYKINIIENINDLSFKNLVYIHDFSGCYNDEAQTCDFCHCFKSKTERIINILKLAETKSLTSTKEYIKIKDIWENSIPKAFFGLGDFIRNDTHNIARCLLDVCSDIKQYVKLLDIGYIKIPVNYGASIDLIKKYMISKQVKKAAIRIAHGNNPSFIVNLDEPNSFNINFHKYLTYPNRNLVLVHPIQCEKTYMKGVISMIYINYKFSHAIIKKPTDVNSGIRCYNIEKINPSYELTRLSKYIVNSLKNKGKYPIIQLNFCHEKTGIYEFLLTKINYVDPKLYLLKNPRHCKKIKKLVSTQCKNYDMLEILQEQLLKICNNKN